MSIQRTLSLVAALVFLSSASAVAQQHQHHGQGRMMGGQGGGMAGMAALRAFSPASLLENQEKLGLSAEQITELTKLHDAAEKTREASLAGHDRNHEMLMEVLSAPEPDVTKARGHFDAAHASMGAAHWTEIETSLEAMKLLTSAQREMVKGWSESP